MSRSILGLKGAGEWHMLRSLLPDLKGKRMLDLGCGYGWHCKYAIEQGASQVVGIDLSEKMIQKAKEINADERIDYHVMAVEDFDYAKQPFDAVLSSLTLHYIESFDNVCCKVSNCLKIGDDFVFSVEHPIFTAYETQEWYTDVHGRPMHWPVGNYFHEGVRTANFLGKQVQKYHKTLTTYIQALLSNDFEIVNLIEPHLTLICWNK